MTTTYEMDASELSIEIIRSIKAAFRNKKINVPVKEADAMDTTEYLLASPADQ